MGWNKKVIDFIVFVIIPTLVITFYSHNVPDVLTIIYVCFMVGLYSLVISKYRNEKI